MTDYDDFDTETVIENGDTIADGFWQRYFGATIPIGGIMPWLKYKDGPTQPSSGNYYNDSTTYALVATFDNIDKYLDTLSFRLYHSDTRVARTYFKITYSDATTYTSSSYTATSSVVHTYTGMDIEKEISKIEFWLREDTGYAGSPVLTQITWTTILPLTSLPDGWEECNGQTLSDSASPLDGQVIPDLNGDNRFLRGNTTSGGTGGASTLDLNHTHTVDWRYEFDTYPEAYLLTSINATTEFGAVENRPPFYTVQMIMRTR